MRGSFTINTLQTLVLNCIFVSDNNGNIKFEGRRFISLTAVDREHFTQINKISLIINLVINRLKRNYLPFIFLTLITAFIFHLIWNKLDMITFITDATGYIALILIAITLMIGSVNLLLKRSNPFSSYFRRDLGIYCGILAVIHSVTGLFVHLRGSNWKYFLNKTANGYTIRLDDFGLANYTGLISTVIILLLLITSNDYSIRKLNPAN